MTDCTVQSTSAETIANLLSAVAHAHAALAVINQATQNADTLPDPDAPLSMADGVGCDLIRALQAFNGCREGLCEHIDSALGPAD